MNTKKTLATLKALDQGKLRVWDPQTKQTQIQVKEAILDFFKISKMKSGKMGQAPYFDKIPLKTHQTLKGVRVVPGAVIRYGSFIEPGAIIMPSFINIGAFVGARSLVDTWATVGSCAQVGKDVHVSGGVGLGGVLEPVQATPVVIEDGVFLGSRSIIVEGVHVESQAVIGAGVVLTASTKILDVRGSSPVELKGRIPARSVVIPGGVIKKFSAGEFSVPCALIIGTRKESTDLKTSLNQALRDFQLSF